MKNTLLLLFIFVSSSLLAQYSFKENYFEDNKIDSTSSYVEFSGDYFLNSSSINNSMSNAALNSQFLDEGIKNNNLSRVSNINTIGLGLGGTMKYKKSEKNFNLTSSVGTHLISNNTFSKDFFEILMYGNKPSAGQRMNLSNTSVFFQLYNKLTLGIEKNIDKKFFIGGSVNIYQSLLYYDAKVSKGNFYTQTSGEQIDFNVKYNQFSSNNDNKALGAGLDFYLMKKFEKGNAFIHVEDFGIIAHKNIDHYSVDSNYAFKGIEVTNIFDVKSNFNGSNKATHELFGVDKQSVSKNEFLPTLVTIGFHEQMSKKILLESYLSYRFINGFIPRFIARPNYFITKNISVAPVLTIGGYGKADLGLNLSAYHKKYIVNCDILELENIIAKQQTSGRGVFLRLGYLL
jgi:hypothetical protein